MSRAIVYLVVACGLVVASSSSIHQLEAEGFEIKSPDKSFMSTILESMCDEDIFKLIKPAGVCCELDPELCKGPWSKAKASRVMIASQTNSTIVRDKWLECAKSIDSQVAVIIKDPPASCCKVQPKLCKPNQHKGIISIIKWKAKAFVGSIAKLMKGFAER